MSTETAPKAKSKKPKIYAVIALVITLLAGTNHYTFRVGYTDVTVSGTDSTASISVAAVDTTTVDTSKTK